MKDITDLPIYKYCNEVCIGCPFNLTEESENAINLGCLPDMWEIKNLCNETGLNWGCHQESDTLCAGWIAYAASYGIGYLNRTHLDTPHYLSTGEIVAFSAN